MNASLVDLARANTSEKRRELLQAVSDLFVDGAEAHSDRETVLFGEVLGRLLDQVPVVDRAAFSDKVAGLERTPRAIALKLAADEIRVAAPVLQHSPVLTDQDLVEIATRQSQSHLVAISKRAELSPLVTDILVDRGGSEVLGTVARNQGARFSDIGFASLASKAEADAELGDALSFRTDLPPEVAGRLVGLLNPVARHRLEFLLDRDQDVLGTIMDGARREVEGSRIEQRRLRLELRLMVVDVREGRRDIDDVVDGLVSGRRFVDLATVLAAVADVPEAQVSNALHKVNGAAIGTICRSLDLSDATYGRLCALRSEKLKLNVAQADAMLREYRELDRPTAERTLRFHKVRSTVARA